nr:hypothetical protein [Tanacetum cinerariifolium]
MIPQNQSPPPDSILRTKTYEDYENELNDELDEPWSDDGVPYEMCDHICEPFHFKNGDTKWPTCNSNEDGFCNRVELSRMNGEASYNSNVYNKEEHEDEENFKDTTHDAPEQLVADTVIMGQLVHHKNVVVQEMSIQMIKVSGIEVNVLKSSYNLDSRSCKPFKTMFVGLISTDSQIFSSSVRSMYIRALIVAGVVSFLGSTIVPYWKGPLRLNQQPYDCRVTIRSKLKMIPNIKERISRRAEFCLVTGFAYGKVVFPKYLDDGIPPFVRRLFPDKLKKLETNKAGLEEAAKEMGQNLYRNSYDYLDGKEKSVQLDDFGVVSNHDDKSESYTG